MRYNMLCRKLPKSNIELPEIGFGGAVIGNLYKKISDADAYDALDCAFSNKLTYIDTAPHYGQGLSEKRIGNYLEKSQVKAIISTKVGRKLLPIVKPPLGTIRHGFEDGEAFEPFYDYSYDGIMYSFEDSKRRLKKDYIDIVLVHDIGKLTHNENHNLYLAQLSNSGFKALEELKTSGQIGAIGIGVNECEICEEILEITPLDVILLAGRFTLLEQTPLNGLFQKCEKLETSIIIGGPFNSGLLIDGATNNNRPFYNYEPANDEIISKVQKIENICNDFNIPISAAALKFPLLNPIVKSVIPGLANASQVKATLKNYDLKIPDELWKALIDNNLIQENAPIKSIES